MPHYPDRHDDVDMWPRNSPTPEDLLGSAVNVAAGLCALLRLGEVLGPEVVGGLLELMVDFSSISVMASAGQSR